MRAGTRNKPQPEVATLFVPASVCNFIHPHTNSSFQGQAGSSAAGHHLSLTAVLLSRDHLSHTPANQGAAWPVRSLTQAIRRLVKTKGLAPLWQKWARTSKTCTLTLLLTEYLH